MNRKHAWHALSPLDGRYVGTVGRLSEYFSEYALMKRRVSVEVAYFKALLEEQLPGFEGFQVEWLKELDDIHDTFDDDAMARIKAIEATTHHDIKAVEYYIKEKMTGDLARYKEFIHLGITSQDINSTATSLLLREAYEKVLRPCISSLLEQLNKKSKEWTLPMLARTHGQPATPTSLSKELSVFVKRLREQLSVLDKVPFCAKFGGATGNMAALRSVYPKIDWFAFAKRFIDKFELRLSFPTTQIEHYDHLASFFDTWGRIEAILIDYARDMWQYISMEYFSIKTQPGEIGSSAMPHKVNPIDFENAEGNLGLARAIGRHFSEKLPISRLQRDLSDSTVLRNIGVPLGHLLLAMEGLKRGLDKLTPNKSKIEEDMDRNPQVISEMLQVKLRAQALADGKSESQGGYEHIKQQMEEIGRAKLY